MFFQNYDRLLKKQRVNEFKANYNDVSINVNPAFLSFLILKLNSLYTNESYKYQEEEYERVCDTMILQMYETSFMRVWCWFFEKFKDSTISYDIMKKKLHVHVRHLNLRANYVSISFKFSTIKCHSNTMFTLFLRIGDEPIEDEELHTNGVALMEVIVSMNVI